MTCVGTEQVKVEQRMAFCNFYPRYKKIYYSQTNMNETN